MLFSLLIANFNNGDFFKDCYKSIVEQTYNNWEVIIVDDCSTDNSVVKIRKLIANDPRFKFFQNPKNRGCGFTKHRCAYLAQGEILGFLDPDDALKEDALEIMIKAHKQYSKVSIITSKYEFVDLNMKAISNSIYGNFIPKNESYLTYGQAAFTHFATFTKQAYDKSKGIDPQMKRAVDQDLYYKMEEHGEHIFVDKILYSYRVHKNSISQNENLWKAEYWHFFAKKNAYLRRKNENIKITNYTFSEFSRLSSEYYLNRFVRIKFTDKIWNKFFLLFKSLQVNPFHKFFLKIKSLLLVIAGRI